MSPPHQLLTDSSQTLNRTQLSFPKSDPEDTMSVSGTHHLPVALQRPLLGFLTRGSVCGKGRQLFPMVDNLAQEPIRTCNSQRSPSEESQKEH